MKRTLINVKLRAGRLTRELAQLTLIMAGMVIGFALFAAVEVLVCRHTYPNRPALECLFPKKNPRHG